jgi:multidrug efflux system membrane fusion protein
MQVRNQPEAPVTVDEAPATRRRRDWKSLLFVLLGIAAIGGLAWWLTTSAKRSDQRAQAAAQGGGGGGGFPGAGGGRGGGRAAVVTLAPVEVADVPMIRTALGTVTPIATVNVRPQASGQIVAIDFTEGQLVRKGQRLAKIDPRPFQATLDQARATLAQSQAQLANSRLDLQRFRTLLQQDSIAQQQVTAQEAQVRQQVALVAANEAAVRAAEVNVSFTNVLAPVSGRVGLRQVDIGNYATAGQANAIVTLTQIAPIDVAFALPEDQVPQVAQKFRSGQILPVTLYDRGRSRVLAKGRLFTLDNQVDATTGTLRAKARMTNEDSALIPNQFVNVDLTVDTLSQTPVAPAAAFRSGSNGDYAYVVGRDRTAHVRYVKLGPATGDKVAVLSGLRPGERVVIEGSDRLTDGAQVRLSGDRPGGRGGRFGARGQGGSGDSATAGPGGQGGWRGRFGGRRPDGAQGGGAGAPAGDRGGQGGLRGEPGGGGFRPGAAPGGAASNGSAPAGGGAPGGAGNGGPGGPRG